MDVKLFKIAGTNKLKYYMLLTRFFKINIPKLFISVTFLQTNTIRKNYLCVLLIGDQILCYNEWQN